MVAFSELSDEEIKRRIKKLDEDIKLNPPTPEQTMWFNFAMRNKGFEWYDAKSGLVYSKFWMWMRYYNQEKELTMITEGLNPQFIRRRKVGWREFIYEDGTKEIVCEHEYKELERKANKRKKAEDAKAIVARYKSNNE